MNINSLHFDQTDACLEGTVSLTLEIRFSLAPKRLIVDQSIVQRVGGGVWDKPFRLLFRLFEWSTVVSNPLCPKWRGSQYTDPTIIKRP